MIRKDKIKDTKVEGFEKKSSIEKETVTVHDLEDRALTAFEIDSKEVQDK